MCKLKQSTLEGCLSSVPVRVTHEGSRDLHRLEVVIIQRLEVACNFDGWARCGWGRKDNKVETDMLGDH